VPAEIDAAFTELPSRQLAAAALTRLRELGCEHGDFRLERTRDNYLSLHDARLDGSQDSEDLSFAVRVVHDGSWGFALHQVGRLVEAGEPTRARPAIPPNAALRALAVIAAMPAR